jgi:hypothetical protein
MPVEAIHLGESNGKAFVLDHVLASDSLLALDRLRMSLPLDQKRPTVDRRFFTDKNQEVTAPFFAGMRLEEEKRPVATLLEEAILGELATLAYPDDETSARSPVPRCHVLSYMRFLEYNRPGQGLAPHTDGTKICEDTGLRSTHTLLLYLTDCGASGGGATRLWRHRGDEPWRSVLPQRGRILLFPHCTWHEGAPVDPRVVGPGKICLRAEVFLEGA